MAVRIPVCLVRRLHLSGGDQLKANLTVDGRQVLMHRALWDRKTFANEMDTVRKGMQPGVPSMDEVGRGARY